MTLDDLEVIFKTALYGPGDDRHIESRRRVAIRAVVAALRDEMLSGREVLTDLEFLQHCGEIFNEILASDGGEAAEYTGGMNDLSVTPAADVCEWREFKIVDEKTGHFQTCEGFAIAFNRNNTHCPSCGKPISFKETP